MPLALLCPGCKTRLTVGDDRAGTSFVCPRCTPSISVPVVAKAPPSAPPPLPPRAKPPTPAPPPERRTPAPVTPPPMEDERRRGGEHSGLGVGSFVIAVLIVGLDAVLGLIVVLNLAGSKGRSEVEGNLLGGVTALVCLNCLSIPLCLIGVGLAVAALIAHKDRNHLLTYIGLVVNALVILALLGLAAAGSMSRS